MNVKYVLKILLIIFFVVCDLCASFNTGDAEKWTLPVLFRKYFVCCNDEFQDEMEILLNEPHKMSIIEKLPNEILWEIFIKLTPREIKQISYSCKKFKENIEEYFWSIYLYNHNQNKWNKNVSADKVAFAYLFYKEEKLSKAFLLGLPQALKKLKEKEKAEKNSKKLISYDFYHHKKLYQERF